MTKSESQSISVDWHIDEWLEVTVQRASKAVPNCLPPRSRPSLLGIKRPASHLVPEMDRQTGTSILAVADCVSD